MMPFAWNGNARKQLSLLLLLMTPLNRNQNWRNRFCRPDLSHHRRWMTLLQMKIFSLLTSQMSSFYRAAPGHTGHIANDASWTVKQLVQRTLWIFLQMTFTDCSRLICQLHLCGRRLRPHPQLLLATSCRMICCITAGNLEVPLLQWFPWINSFCPPIAGVTCYIWLVQSPSTVEKECLAIKLAVQAFKVYLLG